MASRNKFGADLPWPETEGRFANDVFTRQRRSLMIMSLLLIGAHVFDVRPQEISLLSINIDLGLPDLLIFLLWVVQAYFVYNFGLHRKYLGDDRFRAAKGVRIEQLRMKHFRRLLKRNPSRYLNKKDKELFKKNTDYKIEEPFKVDDTSAKFTISFESDLPANPNSKFRAMTLPICVSPRRDRLIQFRAHISTGIFTPEMVLYWMPLFLAEVAVVVGYVDVLPVFFQHTS